MTNPSEKPRASKWASRPGGTYNTFQTHRKQSPGARDDTSSRAPGGFKEEAALEVSPPQEEHPENTEQVRTLQEELLLAPDAPSLGRVAEAKATTTPLTGISTEDVYTSESDVEDDIDNDPELEAKLDMVWRGGNLSDPRAKIMRERLRQYSQSFYKDKQRPERAKLHDILEYTARRMVERYWEKKKARASKSSSIIVTWPRSR